MLVLAGLTTAGCSGRSRRAPSGLVPTQQQQPSLSGDGSKLAVIADQRGRPTVQVRDLKSGQLLQLRHFTGRHLIHLFFYYYGGPRALRSHRTRRPPDQYVHLQMHKTVFETSVHLRMHSLQTQRPQKAQLLFSRCSYQWHQCHLGRAIRTWYRDGFSILRALSANER